MRDKSRRWRSPRSIFALFLVISLVAAACATDTEPDSEPGPTTTAAQPGATTEPTAEPTETTSPPAGGPVQGGDLVFGRSHDNSSLDPVEIVDTATIYVLDHIFETLFRTSDDGLSAEPWLASGYSVSDDGLSWTINLREDVLFSDGSPMTSADVKFSVERAAADSPFGYLLSPIETIDTPDDHTVVFNNRFPWGPFLADLSLWAAGIMPADFGGLSYEEFFENPIGTGPFMFDEWQTGSFIRLVRNPNYWQEGKPYLDSVTWRQVPNDNTRLLQLQDGEAHIVSEVPLNLMESLDQEDGIEASSFPATTTMWVSFNTTVEPFDDVHVRRAIAHAIDSEGIAAATLFGLGGPACSVISPQVPYHDPNTPCLTFDLDAARAELAQSSVPDGFSAEYLVGDRSPDLPIAEIIQDQLAQIGIDVTLRVVDPGVHYATLSSFDYDFAYTGWTMDIPDPDQKIAFMFDLEEGGGDSYSTGYDNPEMTELVRAGQQAIDPEERQEIYSQIQALAASEVPFIPLIVQDLPFAWSSDVQGFRVNPVGKRNLENVWLEP